MRHSDRAHGLHAAQIIVIHDQNLVVMQEVLVTDLARTQIRKGVTAPAGVGLAAGIGWAPRVVVVGAG